MLAFVKIGKECNFACFVQRFIFQCYNITTRRSVQKHEFALRNVSKTFKPIGLRKRNIAANCWERIRLFAGLGHCIFFIFMLLLFSKKAVVLKQYPLRNDTVSSLLGKHGGVMIRELKHQTFLTTRTAGRSRRTGSTPAFLARNRKVKQSVFL